MNPPRLDEDKSQTPLILASASPRRRELLALMEVEFEVRPAEIDEDPLPKELAVDLVCRLSLAKATAVSARLDRGFVVGADSLVVLDGEIFGKPSGPEQARQMLEKLRGTQHQVVTGVTVLDASKGRHITCSTASGITLREITDAEIQKSIDSGVPFDKAGAYAVQDIELSPAKSWEGCYPNIVGLPLCRLVLMLGDLGLSLQFVQSKGKQTKDVTSKCTGECPFNPESIPYVSRRDIRRDGP